ncbi:MAG TPA: ABC transporter permease [Planctomycetota bacterium]
MRSFVIARREWRSAFDTPVAYVLLAFLPAVLAAFFFVVGSFFDEQTASLRRFFENLPMLMVLAAPATTMRLWAEERRSGTEELLMTYPFRVRELVLGKFLGALGLLALALTFTLGVPFTVAFLGDLDWGPVIGGYLGALLLGAASVAVGLFFSALTRNQIVAWLLGVTVLLAFNLIGIAATATAVPPWLSALFLDLDFGARFASIARGVLDLQDAAFFGGVAAVFLCWNGLVIEARRWS